MVIRLVGACLLGSMVLLKAGPADSALARAEALIKWECEESGKWNEATVSFVRSLWTDLRSAYRKPDDCQSPRKVEGRTPTATSYKEYVGPYRPVGKTPIPAFEIKKGTDGLLAMVAGEHALPVVCRNARLLIVSGDVIPSPFAGVGHKLYGELEVLTLILADGEYYLLASATDMDVARWTKLTKKNAN